MAGKKYCLCRGPDDGRLMIACDRCTEWFHATCMNIRHQGEVTDAWYCPTCKSAIEVEERLSTLIEEKQRQFQEQFLLHIRQQENTADKENAAKDIANKNLEVEKRKLTAAEECIINLEEEMKIVISVKDTAVQNLEVKKRKLTEAEERIINLEEEMKILIAAKDTAVQNLEVKNRKLTEAEDQIINLEEEMKILIAAKDTAVQNLEVKKRQLSEAEERIIKLESEKFTHTNTDFSAINGGQKDNDFKLADQSKRNKVADQAPLGIRHSKLSLRYQKMKALSQP